MGNNNQRALCQQLWAENKYLVLSHSSNIYKDIRQYLKNEVVEVSQVQEMIDRACQIPEHRGQVCNAYLKCSVNSTEPHQKLMQNLKSL